VEKVDASQATSDLSTHYDHYRTGAKARTALNSLGVLQILEENPRLSFDKTSKEEERLLQAAVARM
jgi:hypothetical protein